MTKRYRHIPTNTAYWLYESQTGEIQAEAIGDNDDTIRFDTWAYPDRSDYWEREI